MVDMWIKVCEHEQKCWEIYLIIPSQRCHQLRTAGCWSLTIQTQIGPHDCGNAATSSAGYRGISTTVLISIKCTLVFILQYCLGLIVEDIIVWKIEMQALTFCGNDNETRLIVLKP